MHSITTQKGFTLMEAIIYIALFSFIIGGGLLSAYQIFDGQATIQENALREAEINFVMRKLDWALSGSVQEPPVGGSGEELEVTKDGSTLIHRFGRDDTGAFVHTTITPPSSIVDEHPLTTLMDLEAITIERSAGTPQVVTINMTIDGEVIGPITRYVR